MRASRATHREPYGHPNSQHDKARLLLRVSLHRLHALEEFPEGVAEFLAVPRSAARALASSATRTGSASSGVNSGSALASL